jgi:hypothetical protein
MSDSRRLTLVGEVEPGVKLYTAVVWHVSLKHLIRIGYLLDQHHPGKLGQALLFSTDVSLLASDIVRSYKARYQMDFITFR